MTGQRIRELLQETSPVEVDHDFAAPLAGASSLEELVADAVVEVRPTLECHVCLCVMFSAKTTREYTATRLVLYA